ncbi:hypothetical protein QW180_19910 [Vibrio sinaloensis]|nr:hypothetical protein [Vibrio sinaloensis]
MALTTASIMAVSLGTPLPVEASKYDYQTGHSDITYYWVVKKRH